MPMEKYPDLMPWVDAETKRLLGVDDESRYKDDPVELVEDDGFAEYWRDVGTGMVVLAIFIFCQVLIKI